MTLTFAFGLCAVGLGLAALASYVGATLRFLSRSDGKADDHDRQSRQSK